MSLPAADDLFRPTAPVETSPPRTDTEDETALSAPSTPADHDAAPSGPPDPHDAPPAPAQEDAGRETPPRRPSGRVRHDEKMTVYVTADELIDLEHARLTLRRHHGLAVDRGRLVREAVAIALADLDTRGADSVIVQRLQQS